jgi:ferredoxin--NADP+ reductase
MPNVHYFGNVNVGQFGDIRVDQLREAGFDAFMVTTGAQVNTSLDLPGADLEGVYHANDIVFHYNRLPRYADKTLFFGSEIAVIGVGNVMLDIVHYFKQLGQEFRVTAYARRGPTHVKFDNKSLEPVAECLDLAAIRAAVDAAYPELVKIGEDVDHFYALLEKARDRAENCHSKLNFQMRFLMSPKALIGDQNGRLKAIQFERNQLIQKGDRILPVGTGEMETVPVESVVFSIGSRVDTGFGLPVARSNFVTTETPRFPIDGISYEVYNEDLCSTCEDVFVSGWARVAGEGVVGLARKDAERGARAVLQFLGTLPAKSRTRVQDILDHIAKSSNSVVDLFGLQKLWAFEEKIAAEKGLPEFKFDTKEAMLKIIEEA